MISALRKIRYKLIRNNKTSRYLKYAIGEIILVVIGILIALQINEWNNDRNNAKKEQLILASIHKEFLQNKSQLDTVTFYHDRAFNSLHYLDSIFPIDIETQDLNIIKLHLDNALHAYTFNPSQGSINSIVSTSSFDIISNAELRDLLVSWQDLVLDFQEDELNTRSAIRDFVDPFLAEHISFDFDFTDPRNNLEALESLKFEYVIKLRLGTLGDIFREGSEYYKVQESLSRIIELTEPKK